MNIVIETNSLGSGDWVRVVATSGVMSSVLYDGHRLTALDLFEVLQAVKIGDLTGVEYKEVADDYFE